MNLLSLIFFLFAFSFVEGQNNICEPGWIYNDGKCYWSSYLALEEGEQSRLANWYGAELTCRSMHAELPYFNNTFEATIVQSLAGCGPSWLGLVYSSVYTSNMTDGYWVWWTTNEEASVEVLSLDYDNCTSHLPSAAYLVNGSVIADYPDSLYPFVCIQKSNGSPVASNCVNGYLDKDSTCCKTNLLNPDTFSPNWFYFDGKCYLYSNHTVDYFAAQLNCQENKLHLPSIHSQDQNSAVGIVSMCQSLWIGLENVIPEKICQPNAWAWEDYSGNSLVGDFTNNWFKPSVSPHEPQCNVNNPVAYIAPYQTKSNCYDYDYFWFNGATSEMHTFSCVYETNPSNITTPATTSTVHQSTKEADSCSSVHPSKCPNGPVVCEIMGYTYECFCQPGYYLDTNDSTCETGNDLYATNLTFVSLTFTDGLNYPGSAVFVDYSTNITNTLNVVFTSDFGYQGSTVTKFISDANGGLLANIVFVYGTETDPDRIEERLNIYINVSCTDTSCFDLPSDATVQDVVDTNLCDVGYVCPQNTHCESFNGSYECGCNDGFNSVGSYQVGNVTYETCIYVTTILASTSTPSQSTATASTTSNSTQSGTTSLSTMTTTIQRTTTTPVTTTPTTQSTTCYNDC